VKVFPEPGGHELHHTEIHVAPNGRAYVLLFETNLTDGSRWVSAIDGSGHYPLPYRFGVKPEIASDSVSAPSGSDPVEFLLREIRSALDRLG
jgi:hypothetical protein